MTKQCDVVIENVRIASMQKNGKAYGILSQSCVAIKDGKVLAIFGSSDTSYQSSKKVDGENKWLLPGFIDCHTHLVYGGNRANEFEQRLQGKTYTEIAQQGGGIQGTVNATRDASELTLLTSAIKRAARLVKEGVTCIEVKSGYGLDLDTELKMLKVAKQISEHLPVSIIPTYLGAHTVPIEYRSNPDDYVQFVCDQVIPAVAGQQLASCVDVFCESIGFSPAQCRKIFAAAKTHKLNVKAHVEQLSDLKGAKLAAEFGAISVDHIEYLDPKDIPALKQSGTVAVLLPGAFYYLSETQKPPVAALRANKVPMAIATDLNPGSSPIASILTIMNMASVLFGLTPEEVLQGVTLHAAKALDIANKGQIQTGMDADLCLWDIEHPAELVYGINQHRPAAKWFAGREC
ncbi:imidazolonepropionase [Paraglaciecola psychrophila]|uniref:Imidazolonepropionase n=1 Tax=Paraglaciecola psychrophila 170 TaxID=1129794 RepID=K7AAY8_9ALTE|nr:imidazolonepropionase [Paraglaciecola psychrophila]AGH42317.1 imidazolonepropionase [Paraglaciecola psychrophila 170]GAC37848.1 imidazolonepropionase [Paraglaciecola psychrophila 170]